MTAGTTITLREFAFANDQCCSAYRVMNAAALATYQAIRRDGTQKNLLATMQTRAELYRYLDYHAYEEKLDCLFAAEELKQDPRP